MSGIGFALSFGLWLFLYGLNVPLRWWRLFMTRRRREVLAVFTIRVVTSPLNPLNEIAKTLVICLFCVGLFREIDGLAKGIALTGAVLSVLWPFYLRSKTRNDKIMLFDRHGLTVLPPRIALVGQGSFETRIEWKDCMGYSVTQGSILFALRPFGHFEQMYGPYREQMEQVLDAIGVRKLVAYDVLNRSELEPAALERLEAKMRETADEVIRSYQSELDEHGWRIEHKVLYNEEFEGHELRAAHALMHFGLWHEGECVLEQEWLIWEWDQETVELLALPRDRLYEAIDERIHGMIEQRLRENQRLAH
jgi:hypothetical protein